MCTQFLNVLRVIPASVCTAVVKKILLFIFQSLIDFAVSMVLLLSTLTVRDPYIIHNDGVLAWVECRMWNSKFLLWGLFKSSTWNLVVLTFER